MAKYFTSSRILVVLFCFLFIGVDNGFAQPPIAGIQDIHKDICLAKPFFSINEIAHVQIPEDILEKAQRNESGKEFEAILQERYWAIFSQIKKHLDANEGITHKMHRKLWEGIRKVERNASALAAGFVAHMAPAAATGGLSLIISVPGQLGSKAGQHGYRAALRARNRRQFRRSVKKAHKDDVKAYQALSYEQIKEQLRGTIQAGNASEQEKTLFWLNHLNETRSWDHKQGSQLVNKIDAVSREREKYNQALVQFEKKPTQKNLYNLLERVAYMESALTRLDIHTQTLNQAVAVARSLYENRKSKITAILDGDQREGGSLRQKLTASLDGTKVIEGLGKSVAGAGIKAGGKKIISKAAKSVAEQLSKEGLSGAMSGAIGAATFAGKTLSTLVYNHYRDADFVAYYKKLGFRECIPGQNSAPPSSLPCWTTKEQNILEGLVIENETSQFVATKANKVRSQIKEQLPLLINAVISYHNVITMLEEQREVEKNIENNNDKRSRTRKAKDYIKKKINWLRRAGDGFSDAAANEILFQNSYPILKKTLGALAKTVEHWQLEQATIWGKSRIKWEKLCKSELNSNRIFFGPMNVLAASLVTPLFTEVTADLQVLDQTPNSEKVEEYRKKLSKLQFQLDVFAPLYPKAEKQDDTWARLSNILDEGEIAIRTFQRTTNNADALAWRSNFKRQIDSFTRYLEISGDGTFFSRNQGRFWWKAINSKPNAKKNAKQNLGILLKGKINQTLSDFHGIKSKSNLRIQSVETKVHELRVGLGHISMMLEAYPAILYDDLRNDLMNSLKPIIESYKQLSDLIAVRVVSAYQSEALNKEIDKDWTSLRDGPLNQKLIQQLQHAAKNL